MCIVDFDLEKFCSTKKMFSLNIQGHKLEKQQGYNRQDVERQRDR